MQSNSDKTYTAAFEINLAINDARIDAARVERIGEHGMRLSLPLSLSLSILFPDIKKRKATTISRNRCKLQRTVRTRTTVQKRAG